MQPWSLNIIFPFHWKPVNSVHGISSALKSEVKMDRLATGTARLKWSWVYRSFHEFKFTDYCKWHAKHLSFRIAKLVPWACEFQKPCIILTVYKECVWYSFIWGFSNKIKNRFLLFLDGSRLFRFLQYRKALLV